MKKKKIAFFVKQGLDNFLKDIIEGLRDQYEVKKIIVLDYKQINEEMSSADICWFEWCDELIGYASKLKMASFKKIIVRLHSYEAFTGYIYDVKWENVNKIIFVSEHLRDIVLNKVKNLDKLKTEIISNGIDLEKFKYADRGSGFNVAYVGYINFKKGPMLLMHAFKAIADIDSRYKLYIAGEFQEERYVLYFNQMISEMGLQNRVIYSGWQKNLDSWLNDKNYILCTSLLESQNVSVMQAMSKGIKPLIHNFVGAKTIYPKKYVWSSIDECTKMVKDKEYNSREYRSYIENGFSRNTEKDKILKLFNQLLIEEDSSKNISDYLKKVNLKGGNKFKDIKTLTLITKRNLHEAKINTENTIIANEGDIILPYMDEFNENTLNYLNKDYVMVAPRYVFNLNDKNQIFNYYDRNFYKDAPAAYVLKTFFTTGEMSCMNLGSIYRTKEILNNSTNEAFEGALDYIMLSRVFSKALNKKVKITEEYAYFRKVKQIEKDKRSILLQLISLTVSGYYCVKNNIVSFKDAKQTILDRGKLVEKINGCGYEYSKLIVKCLSKEISEEDFIKEVLKENIAELPSEFSKLRKFL